MNVDSDFPTHHIYPEDNPYNLKKYESKGTSKIPISQLFSDVGKTRNYFLSKYSKILIFNLYHELGKTEKFR